MVKLVLKNRKNRKLVVAVDEAPEAKNLVFILHGVGGFKEQEHLQVMERSFREHGYTTVLIDSTDGFGESDGRLDQVSATGNYEDLEDVISWAGSQPWYREPFVLAGHSLGSMCASLYAERYPDNVKALAPISVVVSGKLLLSSPDITKVRGVWEETKWLITDSHSRPGAIKKIPWTFVVDVQKYDLLPKAKNLTMPVLLAVGENDPTTPLAQQKKFFNALPEGRKELHIIKGAFHTFRSREHLDVLKGIFDLWISQLR